MNTRTKAPRVVRCEDLRQVGARAAAALALDARIAEASDRRLRWVAAGGPEAEAAFDILRERYLQALPWDCVTVLMGDERCVERGDRRSNWTQLEQRLLGELPPHAPRPIRPHGEFGAESAADDYAVRVAEALGEAPLIDHLWLGVGANGHTLSLFPGRRLDATRLVTPVHDAPDPPQERISFTLAALGHVRRCLVLAAGAEKRAAIVRAWEGDLALPITEATQVAERGGAEITWIVDHAAAPLGAPVSSP